MRKNVTGGQSWHRILRAVLAPAPAEREKYTKILLHFYVGRRGFMLSRHNVGDMFGRVGSRGIKWGLTTWKDPR